MIQQTQYTPPTPKYNFPPTLDTLPQRIIELSVNSLKNPRRPQTFTHELLDNSPPETRPIKLKPNSAKTPIAAIDVSSIKLGETETGILLAVRGAIVWKQATDCRYVRLGPFPFHITELNKNEICDLLSHNYEKPHPQYLLPDTLHVQTRLTTLLERWAQAFANQTIQDGLILWDGSLMTSSIETYMQAMEKLLKEAQDRRNTILAFSKMTQLLLYGHRITDLAMKYPSPCLLKIENSPDSLGPIQAFGSVYVAKLAEGSCAFRLDVDKKLPDEQAVEAVQKLIGNDLVMQSYPETLRIAHILSTFTANEVIGIKRCLSKETSLKIVTRPNVRRLLFGSFGKGLEG